MPRYFIEVSYKGTAYAGFQIQENANTIQAEIEKALKIYYRQPIECTGSSRTDAGVHALQNYFHFDTNININATKSIYHINAILPQDIIVNNIVAVDAKAHCRFDATARSYQYNIYQNKNPFIESTAYYFPFPLNVNVLNEAAALLKNYTDFESFSKKNTQVNNFNCTILVSDWTIEADTILYKITGNRFLRGMVRGLVGTMLQVGTGKISIADFIKIINAKNNINTDFSVPGKGLILKKVMYDFI